MSDEVWKEHPNGGIVCEFHGHDPNRLHCVLCEIEFEIPEEQDDV